MPPMIDFDLEIPRTDDIKCVLSKLGQCVPEIPDILKLPNGSLCGDAKHCRSDRCSIDLRCTDKAKEGETCDPRLDECNSQWLKNISH